MKRLLKRINARREGATLITVVIATAFLIAIGVVILGASTKYLASVYVDRNATENLYDSEGVLAEVRAGLLEYANEAGKDAYRLIAENYDTIGYDVTVDALGHETKTPVTLRDRFATLYIAGIVDRLRGLYVKGEWDNSLWDDPSGTPSAARRAYNFLKDNSYINDADTPGVAPKMIEFEIDHLKALSTHPSYVTTSLLLKNSLFADPENPTEEESARSKLGCIVYRSASKGYSLVIKGMAIDYNEDPYRQTIETDIRINVPDYKFDGDDLLDSASDFVAIADGKIDIPVGTAVVGTGGVRFDGNVYAGGKNDLASPGLAGYPESGIYVGSGMEAHFNCRKLITRKNVTLSSGSDVEVASSDMAGEAYMRNIKLLSDGTENKSNLKVKTNAYVENDLDIQDSGATVELSGSYYGYSYSKENNASETSVADYSSAILINGYGTSLITGDERLNQLILSGRSYVSRTHQYQLNPADPTSLVTDTASGSDIMMGESVAAKSDQIAYMVPDKYILAGHNPINSVNDMSYGGDPTDPKSLLKSDGGVPNILGEDSPFKDLLNEDEPVTGYYSYISGNQYVFLYLNFKDQKSVNDYFKRYYQDPDPDNNDLFSSDEDRDYFDRRAKSYITSVTGGFNLDPTFYLVAGNVIRNYDHNDTDGFQDSNYFEDDKPRQTLLDDGKRVGKRFVSYAKSLTPSVDFEKMRLADDIDSEPALVYHSYDSDTDPREIPLIDPTKIPASYSGVSDRTLSSGKHVMISTGNPTTTTKLISDGTTMSGDGIGLVMYNGSVTVDADFQGLIIANGEVTVEANFKGLIIATGDVKVSKPVSLIYDSILVKELFGIAQSDPELYKVFPRLGTEAVTNNSTDMSKCITYLNWTKNTY